MLDEEHESLHTDADDTNIYALGRIDEHNVVVACLPDGQTGTTPAVHAKVLVEEHPSRLASQHALAGAYEADGQVGNAVELLEHVVAVKAKVLRDDHPSRLKARIW